MTSFVSRIIKPLLALTLAAAVLSSAQGCSKDPKPAEPSSAPAAAQPAKPGEPRTVALSVTEKGY
ncbi:MAG TPA: copper transporter, partial [Archangium sp.]